MIIGHRINNTFVQTSTMRQGL